MHILWSCQRSSGLAVTAYKRIQFLLSYVMDLQSFVTAALGNEFNESQRDIKLIVRFHIFIKISPLQA